MQPDVTTSYQFEPMFKGSQQIVVYQGEHGAFQRDSAVTMLPSGGVFPERPVFGVGIC